MADKTVYTPVAESDVTEEVGHFEMARPNSSHGPAQAAAKSERMPLIDEEQEDTTEHHHKSVATPFSGSSKRTTFIASTAPRPLDQFPEPPPRPSSVKSFEESAKLGMKLAESDVDVSSNSSTPKSSQSIKRKPLSATSSGRAERARNLVSPLDPNMIASESDRHSAISVPISNSCPVHGSESGSTAPSRTPSVNGSVQDRVRPLSAPRAREPQSDSPSSDTWGGTTPSLKSHKGGTAIVRELRNRRSMSSIFSGQSSLGSRSWTRELLCFALGFAALVCVIALLVHFDGRRLPNWPTGISLNTLIALLVAIANAALAAPLQQGLSQLKWVNFRKSSRPITDIEHFDDASRGVWGSFKLLVLRRGGFLGSFGAVIVILAIAMSPFAQQIVAYQNRSATAAGNSVASIKTAKAYKPVLPGDPATPNSFVPILPMKAAVYNGMFSADPNPTVPFECHTGNCTFPAFSTVAVCSQCEDLSAALVRVCEMTMPINNGTTNSTSNSTSCLWKLPNGASLNDTNAVFGMNTSIPSTSGNMPYSTLVQLNFIGTEAQNTTSTTLFSGSGQSQMWARQCTLQFCVQDYITSVQNGKLIQNITDTHYNHTAINMTSAMNQGHDIPLVIQKTSNETGKPPKDFSVGMGFRLGIQEYFGHIFRNGTATRDKLSSLTETETNIVVNLTVGESKGMTFFDTDILQAFYWYYYEYPTGLDMLTSELAATMTNAFRMDGASNGTVVVNGTATEMATFVHVRWGWIALPLLVVVATGVFLALAMWNARTTRTRLWKSSALALLLHGTDVDTRKVAFSRTKMSDVRVRLEDDGSLEWSAPATGDEHGPVHECATLEETTGHLSRQTLKA